MNKKIFDEIIEIHDRIAEDYGKDRKRRALINWINQRTLTQLRYVLDNYIEIDERTVLLDAGCGNGYWAQEFILNGIPKVVGVDFSENMLNAALLRSKKKEYEDKFEAVKENLENLSFKDNSFDIIHFFGVIEHLDSPQKVLNELIRVVKAGGVLILLLPVKYSVAHISYLLFGQDPRDWGTKKISLRFWEKCQYYKYYTFNEIENMVKKAGKCEIIDRIPLVYSWLAGIASYPLLFLNIVFGDRVFDFFDHFLKTFYKIPSGELIIIRKL